MSRLKHAIVIVIGSVATAVLLVLVSSNRIEARYEARRFQAEAVSTSVIESLARYAPQGYGLAYVFVPPSCASCRGYKLDIAQLNPPEGVHVTVVFDAQSTNDLVHERVTFANGSQNDSLPLTTWSLGPLWLRVEGPTRGTVVEEPEWAKTARVQ